ncbi:MAG: SAF domain-containing protein, partial [Actinomycetota bacterium]|nr:SAF domain-containing protein [Actinomycetota bacterium]
MATSTTTEPAVRGVAPPIPPAGRLRVPQLAVGVLLTAGAALAFVLWNAASVQRMPVLALTEDVSRGQVLTRGDVRVVHIATDDQVATTPADGSSQLVGRAAVTDLPAGTLVVPEQFAVASALTPGAGVVGLALGPGQYPTPQLRVGDLVNVVVASD